jgi:nucleoside-diphosphate-sugar epimerase
MKKLIFTGASGFLGKPIVELLVGNGDYEVYAVTSGRKTTTFPSAVKTVTANLLDRAETKKLIDEIRPEIMVHFAWDLSDSGYLNSTKNLLWQEESLFLLRTFIEAGGKYFAFAGSCSEYGTFAGFSENELKSNVTLYGRTKNSFHSSAEKLCELSEVGYVNLRIFSTLGKGMKPGLAATTMAVAAFAKGEKFICKAPYNVWDFIGVDDVAKAVFEVIKKNHIGVVNIGSGIPQLVGDVYKAIAEKMNSQHLLTINYENKNCDINVANPHILKNVIGYTCTMNIGDMLDDMIASVSAGNS